MVVVGVFDVQRKRHGVFDFQRREGGRGGPGVTICVLRGQLLSMIFSEGKVGWVTVCILRVQLF